MTDPIHRLQFVQQEIDRVFGEGYAAQHPDVVVAVMLTAATDFAALTLARAIGEVAAALLFEDEPPTDNGGIVRPQGGLLRRP